MLDEYEAYEAKALGLNTDELESFNPLTRRAVFKDGTERQCCAVITRIMGYFAEVTYWNIGKKGEHATRKFFMESKCFVNRKSVPAEGVTVALTEDAA